MAPDSFETDNLISDAGDPDFVDAMTNEPALPSPPRKARSLFQLVCMQQGPAPSQGDSSL
jgi:hypothetical protein